MKKNPDYEGNSDEEILEKIQMEKILKKILMEKIKNYKYRKYKSFTDEEKEKKCQYYQECKKNLPEYRRNY